MYPWNWKIIIVWKKIEDFAEVFGVKRFVLETMLHSRKFMDHLQYATKQSTASVLETWQNVITNGMLNLLPALLQSRLASVLCMFE